MDLKQLEYFVHVAEMGSFTRAAAFLQVAQPALSRQVRTLEVELRQPLLDRNGRGVTLTEAGKRLLAHARGILQQVERARDDLEDQRGAATGRLAIALPPSVSRTLTAPLVKAFREQMPRANLSVVEGLSTYALEWLVIGRVDCAVVYNVTPSPAIDLQPLLVEPLYLVSPREGRAARVGKPITLREVAERELVILSRPHSMRMLLEAALAAEPGWRWRSRACPPSWTWCCRGGATRCWPRTPSAPAASRTPTNSVPSARRPWWPRCGSRPRRNARAGRSSTKAPRW